MTVGDGWATSNFDSRANAHPCLTLAMPLLSNSNKSIVLPRRLCINVIGMHQLAVAQNFGAGNDLVSIFHQTLTFHTKGQAAQTT